MSTSVTCRRRHTRYTFSAGTDAWVKFGYPRPSGFPCRMEVKDLSASGLSFIIEHELPGLEVGRTIRKAEITIGKQRITGDLLVMHLTKDVFPGSLCGCLIYPEDDQDIHALHALVTELEIESAPAPHFE